MDQHMTYIVGRSLGICPRDGTRIESFADVWRHVESPEHGHGIAEPTAEGCYEPSGFEEEDHEAERIRLMAEFIADAQTLLGSDRDIAVDSVLVLEACQRDHIRALEQAGFIVILAPTGDYSVYDTRLATA